MGRHRVGDSAPTGAWIADALGQRHRLARFHDTSGATAGESPLLWMFPSASDVDDYEHRDEAYRNLGTSAALHVVRDVFADFDSYVLSLSEQRVVEHRPLRSGDTLHGDVFIETHDVIDDEDVFEVRVVFTDTIGAMVFTHFATFVGRIEVPSVEVEHTEPVAAPSSTLAANS